RRRHTRSKRDWSSDVCSSDLETTIVVVDLISTGGSAISVVEALNLIDAEVQAVLSIFTYGFEKANKRFEDADVPLYTLTDYKTLIEVASKNGFVDESDLDTLSDWREHPESWPN